MKHRNVVMLTILLVLGSAGWATAAPYTWTDVIDWKPDQYIDSKDSFTYSHDITDGQDGFDGFFMGGDDIIWDYSLTVSLYDDRDKKGRFEIARIDQPGIIGDDFYDFRYENQDFGWSFAGLLALNLTGTLDVTIHSWVGDFFLDQSFLTAQGDNGRGSAPVPEPATMILLGTGLLGIAATSRKKFKKS